MEADDRERQPFPFDGTRRSFLGVLLGLASAWVGALLAVPVVRYVFYPLTASSDDSDWADAGSVAVFSNLLTPVRRTLALKQRDGWQETSRQPVVYIIKAGGQLKALSAVCPHLGCTVPWNADRNEFVCPCHGGVFSPDGTHLSGPPPRSLDSLDTRESGGKLMVKYQSFRPDAPVRTVTS